MTPFAPPSVITDEEVDAFVALLGMTPTYVRPVVAEPVSLPREVPPAVDAGSAAPLVASPVAVPPLSRVTPPPPPFYRADSRTVTQECRGLATGHVLDGLRLRHVPGRPFVSLFLHRHRLPVSDLDYVPLWKGVQGDDRSAHGAWYPRGSVVSDRSGQGLWFATTDEGALWWARRSTYGTGVVRAHRVAVHVDALLLDQTLPLNPRRHPKIRGSACFVLP